MTGLLYAPSNGFAQNDPPKDASYVLKQFSSINSSKNCDTPAGMEYICNDMAKYSCKDGTFDDGTGSVLSDDAYEKKIAPMRTKVTGYYQDAIEKILNDPDSKFDLVRTLALQASGQTDSVECWSDKKKIKKECYRQAAQVLAENEAKSEFDYRHQEKLTPNKTKLDLKALSSLKQNQTYVDAMKQSHEKAFKLVSEDKLSNKIETRIFPRVKEMMVKKIEANVTNPKVRKQMVDKINNITYAGNDCGSMGGAGHTVNSLLVENAYYNFQNQSFRFCNGLLLKGDSEFMLAGIIGHELGHAIDPCGMSLPKIDGGFKYKDFKVDDPISVLDNQFPFKGVAHCLRTKESVGANRKTRKGFTDKVVDDDLTEPFCSADQVTESFSDWMGVEILPEYIDKYHPALSKEQRVNGYSNMMRPICNGDGTQKHFDVHPSTKDRANRILMANPEVRKQTGCANVAGGAHYCKAGEEFEGTYVVAEPSPTASPTNPKPLDELDLDHHH